MSSDFYTTVFMVACVLLADLLCIVLYKFSVLKENNISKETLEGKKRPVYFE